MSMMSKLIEDLSNLKERLKFQNNRIGDWKLVDEAIDTIETLGAKVRVNNLNNGWIPCSERLPEDEQIVLTCKSKSISILRYSRKTERWYELIGNWWWNKKMVNAWQPLPEPYREEQEQSAPRMTQEDREKFFRGE